MLETNCHSLLVQYPANFKSACLILPSSILLIICIFCWDHIRFIHPLINYTYILIMLLSSFTTWYAFPFICLLCSSLASYFKAFFQVEFMFYFYISYDCYYDYFPYVLSSDLCSFYFWKWLISTHALCNNTVWHHLYCAESVSNTVLCTSYIYLLNPQNSPGKWVLFYNEKLKLREVK